jgi:hypothetical protein
MNSLVSVNSMGKTVSNIVISESQLASGLVVYWKFIKADITTTSVKNYVDNIYNATLSSASSIDTSIYRVIGRATMRSDSGNYIGFQNNGTTYSLTSTGFTLSYWIKLQTVRSSNENIIHFTNSTNSATSGILLQSNYVDSTKTGQMYMYATGDQGGVTGNFGYFTADLTNWSLFTITLFNKTAKFYVNGVFISQLTFTNSYTGRTFTTMILGQSPSNGQYGPYYYDEMRLYNYPLSATYIKGLYKLAVV